MYVVLYTTHTILTVLLIPMHNTSYIHHICIHTYSIKQNNVNDYRHTYYIDIDTYTTIYYTYVCTLCTIPYTIPTMYPI
jgi:hypothetical protein